MVFIVLSACGFEIVTRVLCHPDAAQGFQSQVQFMGCSAGGSS